MTASWGKLGPLTQEQIRILAAAPPGAFGDIVRLTVDPLWRLQEERPSLYAEALAEARYEQQFDEDGRDKSDDEIAAGGEFKSYIREATADDMVRFRTSVRSIAAVRAAFETLKLEVPEGIREP